MKVAMTPKDHLETPEAVAPDMTWRRFIQAVKNSTMSEDDIDAVLDEIVTAFAGHSLDRPVRKVDL